MTTIDTTSFVGSLRRRGLGLWAGVPDSLLKELCSCASDQLGERFLITANEGNAVGLACGWHVGTGKAAVVYMQNSGAIPLTPCSLSLTPTSTGFPCCWSSAGAVSPVSTTSPST